MDADAERLLRELAPQALGAVIRRFRDFAAAEDAVQEALVAAALQWPDEGLPANPRGWLIQVASRRMTDHVRSEMARRRREAEVAVHPDQAAPDFGNESEADEDDALTLLFMCCHESLTPSSAIALTLRAVGGLTTQEIAKAFLVPEATMAQRISRAKSSIKASGAPFRLPNTQERPERLRVVLHVLYLIFNEGYVTSGGAHLQRLELAHEAIRLARMLHGSLPDDAEAAGLLALMLLTDARREARTGPDGELISADETGSIPLGSRRDFGRRVRSHGGARKGVGRPLPVASRHCRGSRRSAAGRRHRLAADSGALRSAKAHVAQSNGDT